MAVLPPLEKILLQSRESDADAEMSSSYFSEEDALEYNMSEDLEDSPAVTSPPPSSKPEKANKYKNGSLNSSKGVLTCGELLNEPLEVITNELKRQGVAHVHRITIRRGLTYQILCCFKCQRFGHSKPSCRGTLACAHCAGTGHESTDCTLKGKCANCKGDHTFFSSSCPKWKVEKEIVSTKFKQNISFTEARRLVQAQTPTEGKSYASVAKTSLTVSDTQMKPVVILTDSESEQISTSPIKENKKPKFKKKKSMYKSERSLALKLAGQGFFLKDLKSIKSVALELGKTGLATQDLPTRITQEPPPKDYNPTSVYIPVTTTNQLKTCPMKPGEKKFH
ncbi:hypothetical protein AVEN_68051-1 [Araneus ventricosus]|uniref:CCHC-type domain-containing protein n=1 Tax=Araneus ventricosus TaxID=182803 RepID=A0A4Y2M6H7_ARAVE|nr:hypothetical protein AVEN_68051-1 [Araneus ventricosus]